QDRRNTTSDRLNHGRRKGPRSWPLARRIASRADFGSNWLPISEAYAVHGFNQSGTLVQTEGRSGGGPPSGTSWLTARRFEGSAGPFPKPRDRSQGRPRNQRYRGLPVRLQG